MRNTYQIIDKKLKSYLKIANIPHRIEMNNLNTLYLSIYSYEGDLYIPSKIVKTISNISFEDCNIQNLDIIDMINLRTIFSIGKTNKIKNINFKNLPSLKEVDITDSEISEIYGLENTNVKDVDLSGNKLEKINLPSSLERLSITFNKIKELNLRHCTNLYRKRVDRNVKIL